jgi:hypothetical protein
MDAGIPKRRIIPSLTYTLEYIYYEQVAANAPMISHDSDPDSYTHPIVEPK